MEIDKIRHRLEQLRMQHRTWRGDPKYLETLALDIAGLELLLAREEERGTDGKYSDFRGSDA